MLIKSLILFIFVTVLIIVTERTPSAQGERSLLKIHQEKTVGKVNKGLFGNNLYVDLPSQKGGLYENYGGGIWDPGHYKPESKLVNLSKDLGITSFRWPGGNRARQFNWKSSVGPITSRKYQKFGLPEFLFFCEATETTPIITLSAIKDTPEYLADLVEYLNAPADGSNPNGGVDWALKRKNDGKELPWSVKWFEYGNETYNTNMSVESYIKKVKASIIAMKLVDPLVKLGVVLEDSNNFEDGWTYSVLKSLGSVADFGIIHLYAPVLDSNARDQVEKFTVAMAAVSSDADIEYRLKRYKLAISETMPEKNFPLIVSEYNGNYPHNNPVAYRFTLVNSLRNADMLRILLNPEYNIKMANYWLFINAHWGMVNTENNKKIVKQSDALMFKLFHDYLGEELLEHKIESPSFDFDGAIGISPRIGRVDDNNGNETLLKNKNNGWKTKYFSNAEQVKYDDTVNINFNKNVDVNYYHAFKTIDVEPDTLYKVKVKVKAESISGGKVGIIVEDSRGWKKTYNQASNIQISGSTDNWVTVTTEYHTLSDAKKINIVARRIGGKGVISGSISYGDVKVTKIEQKYGSVPSISAIITKNITDGNVYAILINKNLKDHLALGITLDDDKKYKINTSDTLSGDTPFSTNYGVNEQGVKITKISVNNKGNNIFKVMLPPASITGIKLVTQ